MHAIHSSTSAPQVIDRTGIKKTKLYELQKDGLFPMRIKITAHAWLDRSRGRHLDRREGNGEPRTPMRPQSVTFTVRSCRG
jgi:hypothetical protein